MTGHGRDEASAATLEVLYFDGCPSHERLLPLLRELAGEYGVALAERRIDGVAEAERSRFLGSPTVRVDGVDVEAGARERSDYGLRCRLYRTAGAVSGVPQEAWIRRALQAAA